MAFPSAKAAEPPAGCKKRWSEVAELEASLKGERKIPYEPKLEKLRSCHITQPLVSPAVKRAGKPSVAIIVFDVTGSGRVVGQQLIGEKSRWAEAAQKEVSQWLFAPLVEGDIGITRVGVTAVLIVELEGGGTPCGNVKSPVETDLEIRICASR